MEERLLKAAMFDGRVSLVHVNTYVRVDLDGTTIYTTDRRSSGTTGRAYAGTDGYNADELTGNRVGFIERRDRGGGGKARVILTAPF